MFSLRATAHPCIHPNKISPAQTSQTSLQIRGLEGSTVGGTTRRGGDTSLALPQMDIAPVANHSKILREMRKEKGLHEICSEKSKEGAKARQSQNAPHCIGLENSENTGKHQHHVGSTVELRELCQNSPGKRLRPSCHKIDGTA